MLPTTTSNYRLRPLALHIDRVLFFALSLFILANPHPSHAGSNAHAAIYLSWDRAGHDVVTRANIRQQLYYHIRNGHDVISFSITLRWTPCTLDGSGYSLGPLPTPQGDPDSLYGTPQACTTAPPDSEMCIAFPSGLSEPYCFAYCAYWDGAGEPADASFIPIEALLYDSQGGCDTIQVLQGATLIGRSPARPPSLRCVYPDTVALGAPTDLFVSGTNILDGEISFTAPGALVRPEKIEQLGADIQHLRATFNTSAQYDAIFTSQAQAAVGLPGALTVDTDVATDEAVTTTCALTPSNAAAAFDTLDLGAYAAFSNIAIPVDHPEYPAVLDANAKLIQRSPTDTVAIINSRAHNGIGFEGIAGPTESIAQYAVSPRYTSSVGILIAGGKLFDSLDPPWDDDGRSLIRCTLSFTTGPTSDYYLVVGRHARNWISTTYGCTPHTFVRTPTDSLAIVIYSGPGNGITQTVYYDFQELRLAPTDRTRKLSGITLVGLDCPRSSDHRS